MPTKKIIYWDSCVFIHRIERTPEHIGILEKITDAAERGEIAIVTSSFTLCEVAKIHKDDPSMLPEQQERLIVDFFENPYINLRSVDRFVGQKSREILRFKPSIKGKDAVHLATAFHHGVPSFQTYDDRLLKMKGASCIGALRIEEPCWVDGQEQTPSMFEDDDDLDYQVQEDEEDDTED